MAGDDITFIFQFGNLRDITTVESSALTLKTLKELACEFINSKVREASAGSLPSVLKPRSSPRTLFDPPRSRRMG